MTPYAATRSNFNGHCNVPWAILMDPTAACNLKCTGCWAATRKPKPSLGAQIDKMWDIREKKRTLEASIKDLDGQLATIEAELMEDMEANGVDKMTGKHAGVSITSNTVAHVTDWDEMYRPQSEWLCEG